jgi:hypothetical protein
MNMHSSWFAGTPEALREQKVDAGLAFLDAKFGAEKVNAIDLERLDISNPRRCALAQVTGEEYHDALTQVSLGKDESVQYGFLSPQPGRTGRYDDDNERLTAIFRRKIQQRRLATSQS